MKTIKPQKLGLLHRVIEDGSDCYLSVTILAFFSFGPPAALLSEIDLWKFIAAELGKDAVLDMGMPKPRGELLISGRAYPRGGRAPACAVRARLGAVDKTLYAIGDRTWQRGAPTEPQPFTEMPITWERAFGGPGFALNPVGKGAQPIEADTGEIHPLPNIELPDPLITSPSDQPAPAGFGPIDLMWPQRFAKMGTYDQRWFKERFPGFAEDTDLGMFNAAPDDQQIQGFFRGDEPMVLENMHPEKPVIEGALPGLAARAFINRKSGGGETFSEVAMHLDTVHLFPHAERGVLLFRGIALVDEDDAADVLQIVIGAETLGDPRPEAHYRDVLRQRIDPDTGHLASLRESDLLPLLPSGARPPRDKSDVERLLESDDLLRRNLQGGARRKAEENRRQARATVVELGLDPAQFGIEGAEEPAEEEALPDIDELGPFVEALEARAERERVEAESRRAKAEAEARAAYAAAGMDYDALQEEAMKQAAGPPKFSAKAERERLEDLATLLANAGYPNTELEATLADPAFDRKLAEMEAQVLEGYRQTAHFGPAAGRLAGEAARRLREEVVEAHRAGRSLAGRDLTGADLSGLDLHGAIFTGALLEGATLADADLQEANFERAVLAHADLCQAKLRGAKLEEANLGLAKLRGADFAGADLSGAVLYQADLTGASFRNAELTLADLSEATLRDNDLTDALAQLLTLLRIDLAGSKLAGADLSRSTFIECKLDGVDLSGARLVSTAFFSSEGRGAVFRGAHAENLRMVKECAFDNADFHGATLTGANLRGASLAGADFTEARMNGSDLSECDLRGARMAWIAAREARFIRADLSDADLTCADLMLGVLQKARLMGADFTRANLFRADLAKVFGDERTSFDEANLREVRFVPRRPRGQG
ncbi:DUF2169 family type VI secretion system accessory protein [Sorangium sp. So ce1389]|uniref:DUF2169 family type VI secretion system accessory protein n=1 Tax=Sorangium sp. So ce1389 TaxID=3133336 RepID=UPI003F624C7F